jgi:hypothetical protein
MKVVIDISSSLYERAQQAIVAHKYASLGQLASVALENQLLLEGDEVQSEWSNGDRVRVEERREQSPDAIDAGIDRKKGFSELARVAIPQGMPIPTLDATASAHREVLESGWLWGIVNRILPIKIAARSLLIGGEIKSGLLQQTAGLAAQRAEAAAKWLFQAYGETPPPREDSLLTGLPMREPLYRARQRFAGNYFGRLDKSGNAWGALFELGLAGTDSRGRTVFAALTREGVAFAALPNPVIDLGETLGGALSATEIETYLDQVVMKVPREKDCFQVLLGALADRDRSVDDLSEVAVRHLPRSFSPAAVQTMKAGALGRLQDLRFVSRIKAGRSARFAITDAGQAALGKLGQTETVQSSDGVRS